MSQQNDLQYHNSAGRMLWIMSRYGANVSFANHVPKLVGGQFSSDHPILKACEAQKRLFDLYFELRSDIEGSPLSDKQKHALGEMYADLENRIGVENFAGAPSSPKEGTLALLKMAATMLPEELESPKSELNALLDEIAEVQKMAQSQSNPTLRRIVLELQRIAKDAIERYQITGAKGLKAAFKSMLAELMETWLHEPQESQAELHDSPVFQRCLAFLKKVDEIVAKAVKYKPLLEYGLPLLMNGNKHG